jgi:hypothetical protein
MRTCTNCGTTITCGCQDRIASNGVRVCANCIGTYEAQLTLIKTASNFKIKNQNEEPSL